MHEETKAKHDRMILRIYFNKVKDTVVSFNPEIANLVSRSDSLVLYFSTIVMWCLKHFSEYLHKNKVIFPDDTKCVFLDHQRIFRDVRTCKTLIIGHEVEQWFDMKAIIACPLSGIKGN